MKNTFKFSYLTPTPDTLANIALCRWNDALKGLPAFIQIYMQSQHFLQGFGFSRSLSYKEYLNKKITKDTDLKVYVGGYEINLSELLVDHDLDLVKISNGASNLVTFFRITFETEETLLDSNFISHDGTSIPVTEQNITITVELCYSDSTNWNFETQKPLSDLRGNTASALFDMENDDNSDGLYGRDCTLWTTPTEKTIYGSKWQCALPISFLMPDNLSVSNIYFDRQSGEFEALYTVPVVKRFFQNIEKAIYDTHLLNCLHDYNKTEEEINEENNEYIVVGGVNLDENTENLYPVAEDNDHIQVDIAEINSRMVTTHSLDSEQIGDEQIILGEKTFNNKIYGKNNAEISNELKLSCNNEKYNLSLKYSGRPDNEKQTAKLGRGEIYTTDSSQVSLNTGEDAEILVIGTQIVSNSNTYTCLSLYRKPDEEIDDTYYWYSPVDYTFNQNIKVAGSATITNIYPKTSNEGEIGKATNRFNSISTNTINVAFIQNTTSQTTYDDIIMYANVYVRGLKINVFSNNNHVINSNGISSYINNEFKIGTDNIPIHSIYSTSIKSKTFTTENITTENIYASVSNATIGTNDSPFSDIYVTYLTGNYIDIKNTAYIKNLDVKNSAKLPHATYNDENGRPQVTVPVGGIVCVDSGDIMNNYDISFAGQTFKVTGNESIRLVPLDNVAMTPQTPILGVGEYVCLSGLRSVCACLIQKIND